MKNRKLAFENKFLTQEVGFQNFDFKKKGTIEIEDKIKKYAVHLVIQFLKRTILWAIVFTESL